MFTVPLVTAITCAVPVNVVPLMLVMLKILPSTSVSKLNGVNVTVPSSATVTLSLTATGLSFTAVTLINSLAVAVPPLPSLMMYGMVTDPL